MLPKQTASLTQDQLFSRNIYEWMKSVNFEGKIRSGFFEDDDLAWIAQNSKLLIFDTKRREKVVQYQFGRNICIDRAVSCTLEEKCPALFIGVHEGKKSMICCFDVIAGQVISCVSIPYRVTSICIVVDSKTSEDIALDRELKKWKTVLAIGTVEGHVYLCNSFPSSGKACGDEKRPISKPIRTVDDHFGDQDCLVDISDSLGCQTDQKIEWPRDDGSWKMIDSAKIAVTSLYFAKEPSMLAIGFSFGGIGLYSMDRLSLLHQSAFEHNAAAVVDFAMLEPEDDPRATLYLWTFRDTKGCDIEGIATGTDVPSLEMYQLYFEHQSASIDGRNIYKDFISCISRLYWWPDSCSTILSCMTLKTWSEGSKRTSGNERPRSNRILMYFFWIHTDGHLVGCLFDIHSWYHEFMPNNVEPGRGYCICPYVAWHYYENCKIEEGQIPLICAPMNGSAMRYRQTPENQFNYFACSYSLDANVVTPNGIMRFHVKDIQSVALDEISSRPMDVVRRYSARVDIPKGRLRKKLDLELAVSMLYNVRLVPSFDDGCSEDQFRHQLWTAMLENGRLNVDRMRFFTVAFAGSQLLDEFVDWTWNQAVSSKNRLDKYCGLLFDGLTVRISDQEMKVLSKDAWILNELHNAHFFFRDHFKDSNEADQATLTARETALSATCSYADAVLWFVDAGILPEKPDFYPYRSIKEEYKILSENATLQGRRLFINQLSSRLSESLRHTTVDGLVAPLAYPPLVLRDLLSIYLIPNTDTIVKHAIVLYTLLDIENASADALEAKITQRFAAKSRSGPSLATLATTMWYLDKGNETMAMEYLNDAIDALPRGPSMQTRFENLAELATSCGSISTLILPLLSADGTGQTIPRIRVCPDSMARMNSKRSSIFSTSISPRMPFVSNNNNGSFGQLRGTPVKRRAGGSVRDLAVSDSPKRTRMSASMNFGINERGMDEMKALLKVPPAVYMTPLDGTSVYGTPISILKTDTARKRTPYGAAQNTTERSIRFASPPVSSGMNDSAVFDDSTPCGSHSNEDQNGENTPIFVSPTDPEIIFRFKRHRWSMVDQPSPREIVTDENLDE